MCHSISYEGRRTPLTHWIHTNPTCRSCVSLYTFRPRQVSLSSLFIKNKGSVHHHVSKAVRRATPAAAKAWGEVSGLFAGTVGGIGGSDVPT